MTSETHTCGGTILVGGSGAEEHIYCDRCRAYRYVDGQDGAELPDGTDAAANRAAWDAGESSSPAQDPGPGPTTYTIGSATVEVDLEAGTIRPVSPEDGMLLGVGSCPDTTEEQRAQEAARAKLLAAVTREEGAPEHGWEWLDHSGTPARDGMGRRL